MARTEPIRKDNDIYLMKNYFLEIKPNIRNYALIVTGLNTALRISDILNLKWYQVYDFSSEKFLDHIQITEQKTEKNICIALNENLTNALSMLKNSQKYLKPEHFIFHGRKKSAPLSRSQAFRIIRDACNNLNLDTKISPHSLRKTFGYRAWNEGVNPVILMAIYNHSSFAITKRYLGIEQEDKDRVYLNINI